MLKANDKIGYLKLIERIKNEDNKRWYWNCLCELCGKIKTVREDSLTSKSVVSCGCYKKTSKFVEVNRAIHGIEDLSGKVFSDLKVLRISDRRVGKKILWWCKCSCGKEVEVWSANLKNGNTKTCGDYLAHRLLNIQQMWKNNLDDLTGERFGDWLVIKRDGEIQPTRWICECQNCKTVKSVIGSTLKTGSSTSCGCRKLNESLEGQTIGRWTVGQRSQRMRPNGHFCTTYLCKCSCGNAERYVDESRLLNGTSQSCGCVKSRGNDHIASYLSENNYSYIPEYKFTDLRGPNNGLLRFDFAIMNGDDVCCLIEYQGAQHFIDGEFGRQQREITDILKKNYCKTKNIPLFEIKYTDNIDQKLDEFLEHIAC